MAASKQTSVYLGDKLNAELAKKAKALGISRGEYLRCCVVYATYFDAFDGQGLTKASVKTIKAIFDSECNEEYIDFLRAKVKAQTEVQTNNETEVDTQASTQTDTQANTNKNTNTDTEADIQADTKDDTQVETQVQTEVKKKVVTKGKKGVGKSKIPPAKEIQFEGTTI